MRERKQRELEKKQRHEAFGEQNRAKSNDVVQPMNIVAFFPAYARPVCVFVAGCCCGCVGRRKCNIGISSLCPSDQCIHGISSGDDHADTTRLWNCYGRDKRKRSYVSTRCIN